MPRSPSPLNTIVTSVVPDTTVNLVIDVWAVLAILGLWTGTFLVLQAAWALYSRWKAKKSEKVLPTKAPVNPPPVAATTKTRQRKTHIV